MNLRQGLAVALRTVRKDRQLTQEDFGLVSSRTYLSALERGLKSPTVDKLEEITRVMDANPASLLLMAYALVAGDKSGELIDTIATEAKDMLATKVP